MKEGRKKATLEMVLDEIRSTKNELRDYMDKRFTEHEGHFVAIQADILVLRKDVDILKEDVAKLKIDVAALQKAVAVLQSDMTAVKQELKDFHTETSSFHKGYSAKSGRQDTFNFLLVGLLEGKQILTQQQAAELRTL